MEKEKYNPIRTDRIGETRKMNNGLEATITDYRYNYDMDVKFEDGVIVNHITYYSFVNGTVRNPNIRGKMRSRKYKHLGETHLMRNGMKATYVEAVKAPYDILIRFEDGYETHTTYTHFMSGYVGNPNVTTRRFGSGRRKEPCDCLGETRIMKNGHSAKCIAYNGTSDITVQFDTGEIREHLYKCQFYRGNVALVKRGNKK